MSIKFVIVRRPKINSNLPLLYWNAGNKKDARLGTGGWAPGYGTEYSSIKKAKEDIKYYNLSRTSIEAVYCKHLKDTNENLSC